MKHFIEVTEYRDPDTKKVTEEPVYQKFHVYTGYREKYCTGEAYYKNGFLHRDEGPAIIYSNGYQAYYQHGKQQK